MPDLAGWVFHSPRRLLLVVVALLAVLVGIGVAVQAGTAPGVPAGTPPAAGGGVGSADTAGAVRAAVAFVDAWASVPAGQSPDAWRARVAALATPELARGLELTDPGALPGGTTTGTPVVRFAATASSLIEVTLSTGPHVLVTVVVSQGRWLAADVQPLAGNSGDVTPSASGS